jgi:hypothetical protein
MDTRYLLMQAMATVVLALFVLPGNAFIGAGIDLSKHLGDTITFDLNPAVQAAGVAYGIEDMNLGVTWGVDYDIASLAGYPYGYGGVGAVTDANVGYSLGLSMDETHSAGFDGSAFGVPLQQGTTTTTSYNNLIAASDHIQNTQASLLY